ncbi:SURF1 family protein [Rhizobiaceae bacterium n13]|uniref:SURF1-like protein n=2 Tax=Ferirhizobium litorale TaxID=2927786 RepID=A0AAE3QB04_9HYPH|nr:SURF1 family protein [Fererhizobium litorale]MDI7921571.1 SURF1 family protein [Fererhizobium litorale]
MQRLYWKQALMSEIDSRLHGTPLELGVIEGKVAQDEAIDYTPVVLAGQFLNDKERHFFATHEGRTGYYVYTPLALADGRYVFVNRGFVPFENKDPATRAAGQLAGEQQVTGLARARLDAKPSSLVPDNDIAGNIFYWKDLEAMAASDGLDAARVLPFFVDADNTPNPGGLPLGGVTQVDLPNNHLQYALTWYGLAAALVAVTIAAWLRSRRRA